MTAVPTTSIWAEAGRSARMRLERSGVSESEASVATRSPG
jgi:hypothetical protein